MGGGRSCTWRGRGRQGDDGGRVGVGDGVHCAASSGDVRGVG
jgi:hypothetical protein